MLHGLVRSGVLALAAVLIALLTPAGRAGADGLYVPWSSMLPGWSDEYVPSSDNDCTAGRNGCLGHTIAELRGVFDPNAKSCHHNAIFPLAYLRMTQTYAWTRDIPGYYEDVAYMNHMDAVFARYYTDAYYAWRDGNRANVPKSWLVAFDNAAAKKVSGAGDLFLGMNAHINRDLPFVLAATGLVTPDGRSGKRDFDAVEEWLNDNSAPLLAEAAQRFDPTMDDTSNPLIGFLAFQAVSSWRENAWRNAELLVAAPTAEARALVAAKIEADANAIAQTLLTSFSYGLLSGGTAPRDQWCAAHYGDTAPMPYPMGTPSAFGN